MLDDRDGRLGERIREADGRVEIEQVVVRQLFSLQLFEGPRARRNVEAGGLVRILAVAEVLELVE